MKKEECIIKYKCERMVRNHESNLEVDLGCL
jgi:hypothetical protein